MVAKIPSHDLAQRERRRDQHCSPFPTTYIDKGVVFVADWDRRQAETGDGWMVRLILKTIRLVLALKRHANKRKFPIRIDTMNSIPTLATDFVDFTENRFQ